MRRTIRSSVYVALAALVLTGCTPQPSPFDGARTDQDEMPQIDRSWSIDTETSRYQGEVGGYTVYVARSAKDAGVCVIALSEPDSSAAACIDSGEKVTLQTADGTRFMFDRNGFGQEEPGKRLSRFVTVAPSAR